MPRLEMIAADTLCDRQSNNRDAAGLQRVPLQVSAASRQQQATIDASDAILKVMGVSPIFVFVRHCVAIMIVFSECERVYRVLNL
jgi:hypothetical protein